MNDAWLILIMLATVLEKGDTLLKLMQSNDFDRDYSEIVNNLIAIDGYELKSKMISAVIEQKDKVREVNMAYQRGKL